MPSKEELRVAADAFVAKAKAKGVPLVGDETAARMKVGPLVLAHWGDGTFDEHKAMAQLMEQYGMNMEDSDDERERKGLARKRDGEDLGDGDGDGAKPKAKKAKKGPTVRTGPNRGILLMLDELAAFEFGAGEPYIGQSYKKAAKTIQELDYAIESGAQTQGKKKGVKVVKDKVPNVGAGIALKIDQFLQTGTCEKLEAYREGRVEPKEPKPPKEPKAPKEPKGKAKAK